MAFAPVPKVPRIKVPGTSGVVVDVEVDMEVEVEVDVEEEEEVEVLAGVRSTYPPATTIKIKTTPTTA